LRCICRRNVSWKIHLEELFRDFRFALRSLRKDRPFALTAILALALGIGATTMIFSVIDGVLLRPFPYRNADRLASISAVFGDQIRLTRFPVPAFFDFKEQNHVFEDVTGLALLFVRYTGSRGAEQCIVNSPRGPIRQRRPTKTLFPPSSRSRSLDSRGGRRHRGYIIATIFPWVDNRGGAWKDALRALGSHL